MGLILCTVHDARKYKNNARKSHTVAPHLILGGIRVGITQPLGNLLALSLSMADGDMVITPTEEGKVISQVTITKPETLIPENIAEGVEIGGVVGTFVGGGASGLSATGTNQAVKQLTKPTAKEETEHESA